MKSAAKRSSPSGRCCRQRRAHCIEAAFVAACAPWVHGERPLVMYMDCDPCDFPHVPRAVPPWRHTGARFRRATDPHLRYRDPIYRSLRELAMSYFRRIFRPSRAQDACAAIRARSTCAAWTPRLWVTRPRGPASEAHARLASLRQFALHFARRSSTCFRAETRSNARGGPVRVEHCKRADRRR